MEGESARWPDCIKHGTITCVERCDIAYVNMRVVKYDVNVPNQYCTQHMLNIIMSQFDDHDEVNSKTEE